MRFISLLYISLPLMAILILLEAWALAKEQTLNRKDLVASFLVALGRIPIAAFTNGFILALYITLYRYRLFDLSSNNWYTWILCFFCDDFSFYWFHRVSHKSRFLWASHQVHHSSNHFTLSAGIRVPWTSELTGNFLFWAWMPLLGIPPLMVIFAKSVSVVYQFWLHTEKILKMPFWFEAFFNTPSHHRVHHGSNLKYLDKNHGGTLIIWDKIFGTFQPETGRAKYGLTHRLRTANPLVIVFHEWHRLLKDVQRCPSWRQKFCYFFKAPGWSPESNSNTTKELLTAGIARLQKGRPEINKTKTITNKISKMKKQLVAIFISSLLLSCLAVNAQTNTIAGVVKNSETNESISGASILVKGSPEGTYADEKGYFKIVTREKTPVTLIISSVGYQPAEVSSGESPELVVQMKPSTSLEVGVVVAATRAPLRILESPVSVEKFNYNNIINSPASSYYDIAGTLKGVDLTTSSLLFKTISTRGFNGSGSARVNQIVDGMDNQAPGLNFFVGNFVGLTELDVESMELLPGASSALYGPGGMNGTILINSKNPFKYQGLSIQAKQGIMNVDKKQRATTTDFYDYSFRYAKAFNDKFAFKIGGQFISATDWLANDSTNYLGAGSSGKTIPGTRQSDPNYNGVNVYGDETSVDLRAFLPPGTFNDPIPVSRTGYDEKDVVDPKTKNVKLSASLHYKITNNLEAQLMGYWAKGNTVYTGNNRYILKGITIGQYKLELNHKNWFLRSYTTQEDAGEAYSATVTPILFNEAWKRSFDPSNIQGSWYPQYTGALIAALQGGASMADAHTTARAFADRGRPLPGSPEFKTIFDEVRKVPIPGGGRFLETSQLWMTEGQFNFSNIIKFAEIIVGGNIKKYILNSEGTLFIDTSGAIKINETGIYAQVTKKLFNDVLALSASGRFDKNEDFKGHFTPRATALIKVAKDNNLRISYQTAYRFPTTQQKYIRLNVGDYILLGGLPWVIDYMNAGKYPVFELINGVPNTTPYVYKEFKPETARSYEFGYKGLIDTKLLIDAYVYFGKYNDFLGRNALVQPGTGQIYSTVVNSSTEVKTHGFGLGLDYRLPSNYSFFFNGFSDVISKVPVGFQSFFNAPEFRLNTGFANTGLGKSKRVGFNVVVRWQDGFAWDGDLANGYIKSFTTVDAQLCYKLRDIKSMIKLGGTNIFNTYYQNAYANPKIGGLYYVSLAYNIL